MEPQSVAPPSWEVLDAEACANNMSISYEVDGDTGQGYVNYHNGQVNASFLDHPVGRAAANEMFSTLSEAE